MGHAADDTRGPTKSAYRTPLTPVTGDEHAAGIVPQPEVRDTPETTPMASAPTPLEDDGSPGMAGGKYLVRIATLVP